MDAQNAAQSDQTRPAGDSQRPAPKPETTTSPVSPKPAEPVIKAKDARSLANSSSVEDRDSDAETIVLPGKDGHSPSKARKVRQEDRSDGDGDVVQSSIKASGLHMPDLNKNHTSQTRTGDAVKKKRPSSHLDRDRKSHSKDRSAGLSSAPGSPPHHRRQHRRHSDEAPSDSDSDHSHPNPSKSNLRDKIKPGDRLVPHKRKSTKLESDDEGERRKVRRQRTISASLDSNRLQRDHKTPTSKSHTESRHRSISPQVRAHRRSASSQLPGQSNGLSQKKKRLPPPLQSTEYHSDESSASGSPHPRSSKLRALAGSGTSENNASPAKVGPHKKHLDAHGQTLLARACAKGEYDIAKQRLAERREDLNVADYAGNTPLQIAALNGYEDIVKLLIDAGCNLDCVNYDKDTPLLDAVDNGHVGVVRLLLNACVNPRKANVNGEEPLDRVTDDTENAEEIRALLSNAKNHAPERGRTSEDRHSHHDPHDPRDSHAPDSPRHSPATQSAATGRRSGTVRSTKTRNDLLYVPLDMKSLRTAAGKGDEETVARILQVMGSYDDRESMIAAARGGHDVVVQLLLGLGGANPDPSPLESAQPDYGTPILAAIGQENIKVIELLLEQQGFDPTQRYKGDTYYEIARKRQGPNWKEEEQILKNAYDEYKRSRKDSHKTKSPHRREKETGREKDKDREEKEAKRLKRAEAKEEARLQKRNPSSPEPKKKISSAKLSSPKEKRRPESSANPTDDGGHKRGPGRPKKDDRLPSINVSDREASPTMSQRQLKKRTESDAAIVSSDGENLKPRRKLVSKGELRGEREKQRRASMASNASSFKEHPSSPHDTRQDEPSDKHRNEKLSEKYHDRTKALKRDESRDRLSVSGDGSSKRHRASITPDRHSNGDKDDSEVPLKRRRLDGEGKEKRPKPASSSDERPRKLGSHHDSSVKQSSKLHRKNQDEDKRDSHSDSHRGELNRPKPNEELIHVKSEDPDVSMKDVDPIKAAVTASAEAEAQVARAREAELEKQRIAELEEQRKAEDAKKTEEDRKRLENEEKQKRAQEEARRLEEEENKRKEELERKRREDEEREIERIRKEDEERKQKEAERRREEEERQRQEAEEKARREEAEKQRREAEEKRKREEEERKQREEEERQHQEQLEREAAEEARRQREEEERKERERRDRAHREEMERKRAAREAEQRRIREEQERARLDKLPPLLRWLDTCPNPKLPSIAQKFSTMQGCRYDTIRPEKNRTAEGREQWVLNIHVALLLGEKDLDLSRYTAWERVPASHLAKLTLWRLEGGLYSLTDQKTWDLGRQLPDYYGGQDPSEISPDEREQLKREAWKRFQSTEMFFVKVSDLMYTIPNIPHLRNVELAVEYRELLESEEAARKLVGITGKWKQDPDANRYRGFAPRYKLYMNGNFFHEVLPQPAQTSRTPFPERRVPRRGLVQVMPDDPDYARICLEQGLEHLLNGHSSPTLVNGIHSSPMSQRSAILSGPMINGTAKILTPGSITEGTTSAAVNGGFSNGINGFSS